jgi:hypothetical protein
MPFADKGFRALRSFTYSTSKMKKIIFGKIIFDNQNCELVYHPGEGTEVLPNHIFKKLQSEWELVLKIYG